MHALPERYALLIGAMKAGTTALYMALARHPEIAPCREKEPEFWVQDERRAQGMGAYRALWDSAARPNARWRMEGSTSYTKIPVRPSAAVFLRRQEAEFRFIYLTRNPMERIRSQYVHSLAEGWIGRPITAGLDPRAVWFSNYRVQLQPYVDFFGREAVLVLSYEELVADPAATLERVYRFLEIDPSLARPRLPRANESDLYLSMRLQRAFAELALAPSVERPDPQLPSGDVIASARVQAAASGRPQEVDAAIAELRREVTPTAEQIEQIHAALDEDLRRFELEWGLDPWTGRRLGDRVRPPTPSSGTKASSTRLPGPMV